MKEKNKILAISGSTRVQSTNLNYIRAIAQLSADIFEIKIFQGLTDLPHFNPDLDIEFLTAPEEVKSFRQLLREADGILICTPEYAMGVPGTLKNAIDWTVSSCEFMHKPTALVTASSQGSKGHASLIETLNIIEAMMTPATQLLIPVAKTKINSELKILDEKTLNELNSLILELHHLALNKKESF